MMQMSKQINNNPRMLSIKEGPVLMRARTFRKRRGGNETIRNVYFSAIFPSALETRICIVMEKMLPLMLPLVSRPVG